MRLTVAAIMLLVEVVLWRFLSTGFESASETVVFGCVYFSFMLLLDVLVAVSREQKMRWIEAFALYAKTPKWMCVVIGMSTVGMILSIIRILIYCNK